MKYLLIAYLFLFTAVANAQLKTYTLNDKGDTLNRVDAKGLKQGAWIHKYDNLRGERGYEEEGVYKNDKREGVWRQFSLDGDLIAVENYAYGMKNGKCVYFTYTGEPLREEMWRAIDPKSPFDTVDIRDINDPSKILRKQIVKVEPNSYKNGVWKYYNTETGAIERTEEWVMNRPKEEVEGLVTDDMAPIETGNSKTAKAGDKKTAEMKKPQAIIDFEKKNAGKKKIKVRDGSTGF